MASNPCLQEEAATFWPTTAIQRSTLTASGTSQPVLQQASAACTPRRQGNNSGGFNKHRMAASKTAAAY